jgi:hypothetical protein
VSELLSIGSGVGAWVTTHPLVAGVATALIVLAIVIPPVACWFVVRRTTAVSREVVHQIEHRLSQVCSAVELLTDTTESGLQSAFGEIQRLLHNDIERLKAQPALQARVGRAAEDGRTAREIAQREGVSEGEAHLRMVLNTPAFLRKATPAAPSHPC